jgi:SAM-dependent methyltransferase
LKTGHPHDVYSIAYYGSAPSLVQAVLDRWQPTPGTKPLDQYTFIDFGSGKGRVVLLAARLPFRKCIGVELNQALHATAAENMQRWKDSENAISPMQAVCQSAAEFSFPETPCVAYLFNPFTAKVLSQVRDRMAAAFANRPGELDILYVNDEFRSLFQEHPGFTMLWESPIAMSPEDSAADILHEVETFRERPADGVRKYPCSAWRWVGTKTH